MAPENVLEKVPESSDLHDHHQSRSVSPAFVSTMIVGIVMLIVLIHIGFYKTYIQHFPKFEDYTIEGRRTVHFNGSCICMVWL